MHRTEADVSGRESVGASQRIYICPNTAQEKLRRCQLRHRVEVLEPAPPASSQEGRLAGDHLSKLAGKFLRS